jgi:release factor glutamine methyltransferase
MTIQQALSHYRQSLVTSPTAYLDVELLLQESLGISREELHRNSQRELTTTEAAFLESWLARRQAGEPIAYILGYKDFYRHRFAVGPGVLIPRPDTEGVVDEALRCCSVHGARVADFGAGSGCIGLSLLMERQDWKLCAVESSPLATQYLKKNVQALGLGDRVSVLESAVEALDPQLRFDLIVANPPYISWTDPEVQPAVRAYEPSVALFADDDGFAALREWSRIAKSRLHPGGTFITEIGFQQSAGMLEFLSLENGLQNIRILKDLAGLDRLVAWEVQRG